MQTLKWLIISLFLCTMTVTAIAEPAPVYDVDSAQDEVESDDTQEQDLPPPPPPGQEGMFMQPGSTVRQVHASIAESDNDMPLEQRFRRIEQQINNIQLKNSNVRIDALQSEIQNLRGQVEQLTHKLSQVEGQQKKLYTDIDKRLLNSAGAVKLASADSTSAEKQPKKVLAPKKLAEVKEKPAASKQPNVQEEQDIYQTAYDLIKEKKYDEAVNALQMMLQKYPTGQFASNAHYWLGELYGLMDKNKQALSEFNLVVSRYPDSPRVSDAQLKVGLIYAAESRWSEAKAAFKKVINRYPGSASAKLASQHLKQISEAGH